jgi:hypothetical protein
MTVLKSRPGARAALISLIVLQVTMLAALFTKTPPHPPLAVAPFALGPFLGASISVAAAAMALGATATRLGAVASVLAAALALVSFGPQKWVDPAIAEIWPAVLLGQVAAVVLCADAVVRRSVGSSAT